MKKMSEKEKHRGDLDIDIHELVERFKVESQQIQETFSDIEDLLKRSKKIMKQLLRISDDRNQDLAFEDVFFEVAPPAAAPVAPVPPAAAAPAAAPAPVTPIVQIITKDIARIARQIREEQSLLRFRFALLQIYGGRDPVIDFLLIQQTIESFNRLQALRDELNADIVLLLGIAGEL